MPIKHYAPHFVIANNNGGSARLQENVRIQNSMRKGIRFLTRFILKKDCRLTLCVFLAFQSNSDLCALDVHVADRVSMTAIS